MKFIQHHTQYMNSLLPSVNSGPTVYEIRIHDPFNIDENFFKDVPKNTPLVINQGFEEYDLFKLKDYKGIDSKYHKEVFNNTPIGVICHALASAGIDQKKVHYISPLYYESYFLSMLPSSVQCEINFHYCDENKMAYLQNYSTIPNANYNQKFKYQYAALNAGHHKNLYKTDFVYLLWKNNLLKNGYVTLNRLDDILHYSKKPAEIDDLIEKYLSKYSQEFLDLLPLKKTMNEKDTYHENSTRNDFEELKNIKILTITETLIDSSYCYLTPKTWRAIACKKPFLIIGHKNSLQKLRDMGFKTFGDYWDESYDQLDIDDRMHAIIQILKEDPTLKGVEPILEHNYKLLTETNWAQQLIDSIEQAINLYSS